jgi:hypothetical protein
VENFKNSNFKLLLAFRRTLAEANQMKSNSLELHCSGSLHACSHAPWHPHGRLQRPQPRPKPGEAEGRRRVRPGPPPRLLLLWTFPTTLPSPEQTHSLPRPSQDPSSTRPWPPCPERPSNAARAPAATSFWTALPSTLRPIKGPSDQTNQRTPSPATSQTRSLSPACSSSP